MSRYLEIAKTNVKKAIKRAGTTDTWEVCQELEKLAAKRNKKDPIQYIEEKWEIEKFSDLEAIIKEVSEGMK